MCVCVCVCLEKGIKEGKGRGGGKKIVLFSDVVRESERGDAVRVRGLSRSDGGRGGGVSSGSRAVSRMRELRSEHVCGG